MNWEILRGPARATLNDPNFQSLCELEKTSTHSLKPRLKSLNFDYIDRELCLNLSSTVENKMRSLLRLVTLQSKYDG